MVLDLFFLIHNFTQTSIISNLTLDQTKILQKFLKVLFYIRLEFQVNLTLKRS